MIEKTLMKYHYRHLNMEDITDAGCAHAKRF